MKNWKEKCIACGIKPWTQYLLVFLSLLVFAGISFGLYYWKRQPALLLYPGLAAILYFYFFFSRYGSILRKEQEKKDGEFVVLFTYFSVYLQDGYSVYNALENVLSFASKRVKPHLEELIRSIEEDKSLTPFLNFSSHFKDLTIREVMISVYQMVDQGASGVYLTQFRHLFGKLSDQKHALEKQKKKERLESLTILPLLGSGIAMLALMMALVEIIGGMLRVL